VPAILEAWHPGTEGGNAITDLLFGDANPGGKLPITWPRNVAQVPIYYAHNLTHQPETAPGFNSRYWDQPGSPLYPFGYGLSYTKFAVSNLKASPDEVTAEVQNIGSCRGDEVVQVYVHQRAGSASRPVRELKGFHRVTLAPGEKKSVRFTLGPEALRFWSAARQGWVQDAAEFDVWVGADSAASLHASFQTQGTH
jgi:beta-glucosidase